MMNTHPEIGTQGSKPTEKVPFKCLRLVCTWALERMCRSGSKLTFLWIEDGAVVNVGCFSILEVHSCKVEDTYGRKEERLLARFQLDLQLFTSEGLRMGGSCLTGSV